MEDIRISYTVIVLYLSEFTYLLIYLICLFILFIYQTCIRNILIKNVSVYISENVLYIMIYKYDIYEFISYLVYRKEQVKIRGKSREKTGRKYDKISQVN